MALGHYWKIIIHLCLCFGLVKTCIFHFLSCKVVNTMGTITDCLSRNLGLAAELYLRKYLCFYPAGHRSVWYQETTSPSTERRLRPQIQHLHHSLTFALPATLSHKHWQALERQGRHLSDTVNYKRMFPPVLVCGVNGKTKLDLHWQPQVDLNYCIRGLMMLHSRMPLFTILCVSEETHNRNNFDLYKYHLLW